MNPIRNPQRRRAIATLAALCAAAAFSSPGACTVPRVAGGLVQFDVYDRIDGTPLAVYDHDGKRYIVGAPGHEYAVRIRNCTGARVLVVTSVDGVNVISGETASAAQSGYVLDPWGSVEIAGWRKSQERIAAFYFTEHANAYATRTGRPNDVGVIGVAVFRERPAPIAWREPPWRLGEGSGSGAPHADMPSPPSGKAEGRSEADNAAAAPVASAPVQAPTESANRAAPMPRSLAKLGTGHGRSEESRVDFVRFERASDVPAEVLTLNYDRRENLVAMGVLPPPVLARHTPNPFPGDVRFAPDPTR
jgi:hypothetical protein